MSPLRSGLLALLSLLFLIPAEGPAASAGEPRIRVLLAEGRDRALAKGEALRVEADTGEGFRTVVDRLRLAAFRPDGSGGVLLEGTELSARAFRVTAREDVLEVDGAPRRGALLLTAQGTALREVASMLLEPYLAGLVNGEVSSAWPLEAVKAQVVAARSYALSVMARGREDFDVRPDVSDQVYSGVFAEDGAAVRAVRETRGLVLQQGGEVLTAFYHSTCGGRTAGSQEVWGTPNPSLVSVACGDCGDSPKRNWEVPLKAGELNALLESLHPGAGTIRSLGVRRRTPSGRVEVLSFGTERGEFLVDGADFRRAVGTVRLPSTLFSLLPLEGGVQFRGEGYGHGVGMCQWGARGAASRGLGFREILLSYYPGAEIRRAF